MHQKEEIVVSTVITSTENHISKLLERYSSFQKLKRIIDLVLRFIGIKAKRLHIQLF